MSHGLCAPIVLALTLALTASSACGRKKGGSDEANDGSAAVDGQGGSTDPHPSACTTCDQALVTQVTGCAATVGSPQPCEGFCFVQPQVTPEYNNSPEAPTSGPAFPSYEYWNPEVNFHSADILPRGTYVHNLAHGFIVLAYNCPAGCPAEVNQILNHRSAWGGRKVMFTEDKLLQGSRFAALGWTWAYRFDTVDLDAVDCFVEQHENHGLVSHSNKVVP